MGVLGGAIGDLRDSDGRAWDVVVEMLKESFGLTDREASIFDVPFLTVIWLGQGYMVPWWQAGQYEDLVVYMMIRLLEYEDVQQ